MNFFFLHKPNATLSNQTHNLNGWKLDWIRIKSDVASELIAVQSHENFKARKTVKIQPWFHENMMRHDVTFAKLAFSDNFVSPTVWWKTHVKKATQTTEPNFFAVFEIFIENMVAPAIGIVTKRTALSSRWLPYCQFFKKWGRTKVMSK